MNETWVVHFVRTEAFLGPFGSKEAAEDWIRRVQPVSGDPSATVRVVKLEGRFDSWEEVPQLSSAANRAAPNITIAQGR